MDIKKFDLSRLSGNRSLDPELIGYDDSLDIIKDELHNLRKSFIKIGWYLKHINEKGMYQKDGYKDIFELAYAKFRMSEATVNRMINLCIEFSVNHNSPELDEQYQDFSESQLFEMLPMKQEERNEISPEMTVKEIREIKVENKTKKEPSEKLVKAFLESHIKNLSDYETISDLKKYMVDMYGKGYAGGSSPCSFKCTPRGIRLKNYEEITWLAFAKKAWVYREHRELESTEMPDIHDMDTGKESVELCIVPEEEAAPDPAVVSDQPTPNGDNGNNGDNGDDAGGTIEREFASLIKKAVELSWSLYEGFRFSSQNHTLSEVEKFQDWSASLNDVVHALCKFKSENNL